MSLLLDQKLVGEVAEYCPDQFLNYYKCLEGGDAMACLEEQKTLSTCVKATAPSFKKIIKGCSNEMNAYETCIKENPDYRTQCFDKLSEMRSCVKMVLSPQLFKQENGTDSANGTSGE